VHERLFNSFSRHARTFLMQGQGSHAAARIDFKGDLGFDSLVEEAVIALGEDYIIFNSEMITGPCDMIPIAPSFDASRRV
jgi:hypothetical protein